MGALLLILLVIGGLGLLLWRLERDDWGRIKTPRWASAGLGRLRVSALHVSLPRPPRPRLRGQAPLRSSAEQEPRQQAPEEASDLPVNEEEAVREYLYGSRGRSAD